MKRKPKVSFVIQVKNEASHIGQVLDLIYRQTYNNFEVIIVYSKSKDRTLEIVRSYPVKLINVKSKGYKHARALNLGISKSSGDYIVIINGHAIPISDTWLADGIENFSDDNVAGVTGGSFGTALGYYSKPLGSLVVKTLHRRENYWKFMSNTNSIIRKDLWKLYPYDEKIPECEDYDWASEMLSRGYNIVKDPRFAVIHGHSLIGRKSRFWKLPKWRRIASQIDKKKRPGESFTKLKR